MNNDCSCDDLGSECPACEIDDGVSESALNDLLCAGQINPLDIIWITYKGNRRPYDVVDVLMPGTDTEEILLDIDDNLYFITSMALDGSSWAKNVKVSIVDA